MKVRIDQIKIKKRMRVDIGAIHDLRESMRKHGLISPITVSQKFELLAGYRRLQAARELGWHEIECNIINAKSKLEKFEIETDENIYRKNFTSEELELISERRNELQSRGFKKIYYLVRRFFRWLVALFKK